MSWFRRIFRPEPEAGDLVPARAARAARLVLDLRVHAAEIDRLAGELAEIHGIDRRVCETPVDVERRRAPGGA